MQLHDLITLMGGRVPGQLVIQFTDKCNAFCPQCGMRVTEQFSRSKLDTDHVKRLITSAAARAITAVSFTGGEPLLFLDELVELLRYARAAGIRHTRTGTNGYLFRHADRPGYEEEIERMAEMFAEAGLYTFWISMDSADPFVHESMRGLPGVVAGIRKALPLFHKYGIYPAANLGISRNISGQTPPDIGRPSAFYRFFRDAFSAFYSSVIDMGFTIANACYPMSTDRTGAEGLSSVYRATSGSDIVRFSPDERALVFKALFETIPEFRAKIRIFTPRSGLYSLMRQYTVGEEYCYPCRGGIDFFFVDARDGNTYPCGYRGGEKLGKLWYLDMEETKGRAVCRQCDWECFRDPSELAGPVLTLFSNPMAFFRRAFNDRHFMGLWAEDLRYYSACGLFDCSKPPDYKRLSAFGKKDKRREPPVAQ